MSEKMPILLDGPMRGRQYRTSSHSIVCPVPVDLADAFSNPVLDPMSMTFRQIVYNLHRYVIFGRVIWVGISGNPDSLEVREAMWEFLTSPECKAAASEGAVPPPAPSGMDAWWLTFAESEQLLAEAADAQAEMARRPSERRG